MGLEGRIQEGGLGGGVRPRWWCVDAAMVLGKMFRDADNCCVSACLGEKGDEHVTPDGPLSQRSRSIC